MSQPAGWDPWAPPSSPGGPPVWPGMPAQPVGYGQPYAPGPPWGEPAAGSYGHPRWAPVPLPPPQRSRMPLVLGLAGSVLVLVLLGVGGTLVALHGHSKGATTAQLQTPEGVLYTLSWPVGMTSDTDSQDLPDGADLTATDDGTHFLDVYTGNSIASSTGDVAAVAQAVRAEDSRNGATLGATHRVGHSLRWTESYPESAENDPSTDVIAVQVVDHDYLELDYNGDPHDVSTTTGDQADGYVLSHLQRR